MNKCGMCKKKLIMPYWKYCNECDKIRNKKNRLAYYHKHKDLQKTRVRRWQKRYKERNDLLKKENYELYKRLAKEIYGVDIV